MFNSMLEGVSGEGGQAFIGRLIKANNELVDGKASLSIIDKALIVIGKDGNVMSTIEVAKDLSAADVSSQLSARGIHTTILTDHQWIIPGFIDLHYHAPQLPMAGTKLDAPLEEWLQKGHPLEARCADSSGWASAVFDKVVKQTLENGTVCAAYYASVHGHAASALAEACVRRGQRAFVGKVAMDNQAVCGCEAGGTVGECLCMQDVEQNIKETEQFFGGLKKMPGNENRLVIGIITPRFVPSCSTELLQKLGDLRHRLLDAGEPLVPIQTHAFESKWQVSYGETHRGGRDLEILGNHGLGIITDPDLALKSPLLLAHVVHPTVDEIRRMAAIPGSVGIAHCPISNAFFADGIMRTRAMMKAGLLLGLERMWVEHIVQCPRIDVWSELDTIHDLFQKFIMLGDDRCVRKVYVQGVKVVDKTQ
ncbi:hypothetical protein BC829DRAFT_395318 [Chytridium lagenaria]|nr:hypothetical protein BC829DRAFT_395318 [Chytridium lagenaria]